MDGSASGSSVAAESEVSTFEAELTRLMREYDRLREREQLYRASGEVGKRFVWSADSNGKLTSISQMISLLTGVSEDQALRGGWARVVHSEDHERVSAAWRRSLSTGDPFEVEFKALFPDGSVRAACARAIPFRDEQGNIVRWYGSTEEIHEERDAARCRREAEARRREIEDLYRYSVELSRQIVWKADTQGSMLYLSERFREVTGEDPEKGCGDGWQDFLHPHDRDAVVGRLAQSLVDGSRLYVEFRLRGPDGNYRFFCCRAAPQLDARGNPVSWYGSVEDIDERKRAEIARREVEERYRLAAKATNDAIWDADKLNGGVEWSEAAPDVLGWPAMKRRTSTAWWESRIHPEDKIRVLESYHEAFVSGKSRWTEAYRFLRADGSYADLLDRGFIIRSEDGRAVRAVGAIADLTERYRAEAELQRIQAELVHVSRVKAMGTMASTLAHELNQPLTAVSNYVRGARRMMEDKGGGPLLMEAMEAAESSALRAGQIVRRLRELVSNGTVGTAVEHLPKLIEEANVLAFLDEELHGIRHRVEIAPDAQWVRADRIQIQQVLINLIRNAVEAMKESPVREVVISTGLGPDGMIQTSVADTGPGIPPDRIDSLFSEFMTTKKEGMGIGLPISRTIVEAHDGQIWAANREGGGAVFCFTLPRAEGPRAEGIKEDPPLL